LTLLTYVSAVHAIAASNSEWKPDALLNRTDADITLAMLNQNDIGYPAPSDDPWMPAHIKLNSTDFWIGDYSLNLMACIDQYQICNPNTGSGPSSCTMLSGQVPVIAELGVPGNTVGLNEYQMGAANRILITADTMSIYYAVASRGASALNGQSTFS
jgi:hypothetical protein